jgi:hypothetical protein
MTSKRTISATNEAGFNAKNLKVVVFARLDFSSGVQRFHTEIGSKTITAPIHGSETYTGIGDFGGIVGTVKESVAGAPINITLALTGVDSTLINKAFVDDYFRRDAMVLIGLEDETGDMLDNPTVLFDGYMDKVDITFVKNEGHMQLALESRATNLLTASDHRFTDEDLQADYSGDVFAEYVYRMTDLVLRWGGQGVRSGIYTGYQNNDGKPFRRR